MVFSISHSVRLTAAYTPISLRPFFWLAPLFLVIITPLFYLFRRLCTLCMKQNAVARGTAGACGLPAAENAGGGDCGRVRPRLLSAAAQDRTDSVTGRRGPVCRGRNTMARRHAAPGGPADDGRSLSFIKLYRIATRIVRARCCYF